MRSELKKILINQAGDHLPYYTVDHILSLIESKLPKELSPNVSAALGGSAENVYKKQGWNDCLEAVKKQLEIG